MNEQPEIYEIQASDTSESSPQTEEQSFEDLLKLMADVRQESQATSTASIQVDAILW